MKKKGFYIVKTAIILFLVLLLFSGNVLARTNVKLSVNPVFDSSTYITGKTSSGAKVTVTDSKKKKINSVTANRDGTYIIKINKQKAKATIYVYSKKSKTTKGVKVTIQETKLKSIHIKQTSMELGVNQSKKVGAFLNPSNATNKKVTWGTNNKKIATVSDDGTVKGISTGTTSLYAKSNGKTSTTIKIVVKRYDSLKVKSIVIKQGSNWYPEKNIIEAVNEKNERIDLSGVACSGTVDTDTPGKYTVTYTFMDISASAEVTVIPPEVATSISWTDMPQILNLQGFNRNLTSFIDGGNQTHTYTSVAGTPYKLKTKMVLPFSIRRNGENLNNPQSFTIIDNYVYIVSLLRNKDGYGYIIKMPLNCPTKMYSAYYYLNHELTSTYYVNKYNEYKSYKKYVDQVVVSPMLEIGHGQTINHVGKDLYMLKDMKTSGNLKGTKELNVLQKIDSETLVPKQEWGFEMIQEDNGYAYNFNTLAMVDENNFYVSFKPSNAASGYYVFKGTINEDTANVKPIFRVANRVGYYNQGLAYDSTNKRIYILSDDAFTSFDESGNNVESTLFNTNREYESMTFHNNTMYILLTKKGEILMKQ